MRLFEVADSFVTDLETILRNLVGRGDSKHAPQSLTWPALSNLLKNMGYGGIDQASFAKVYDQNPQLKPLIKDYNDQGLILGTKTQAQGGATQMPVPTGPSVDQMAKSGAATHLANISK